MNFWKKKKTNHHHHHHHRENVSDNISIGREEKRREERERDSRLVRDREKRSRRRRRHIPHVPSHWREERKREKIFEFVAQKKRRGFQSALRNGRKTRTLLPPPPGFVVEVVDFRAGFFSTSSSENRFGVGARRALFLSLIVLNRKVFFVNVNRSLWF